MAQVAPAVIMVHILYCLIWNLIDHSKLPQIDVRSDLKYVKW